MTECWIHVTALDAITAEAAASHPLETGGVLMGYWYAGQPVITHAIGPGPAARHKAHDFHPDAGWQQDAIARVYDDSGRRYSYLGDWHTHPGGTGALSRLDRRTLTRIASFPAARVAMPVMLVGADRDGWRFVPWRWRGVRWRRLTLPMLPEPLPLRTFG